MDVDAAAAPVGATTTTAPSTAPAVARARHRLVLEPVAAFALPGWAEIWEFRDLLFTLASRDLKVRYKQTALGLGWIVLQPLIGAVILTFVFTKVANVAAPDTGTARPVPYFLLSFSGMLVWTAFSSTLTRASNAMVGNAQLVSKVYFPRLILPLSTMLSTMVDVAVMFGILLVLCLCYRWLPPGPIVVLLPVFVLVAMLLGVGVGTGFAGLAVKYRDVQYLLPVITQMLLFASPVAYAASRVGSFRTIYLLNPLVGVIEGFRTALLGTGQLHPGMLAWSVIATLASLAVGVLIFTRMERTFADVI